MELLTDIEKSNIIFKSINMYKPGENDLFVIIPLVIMERIKEKHMQLGSFDPADIYNEIKDCFDFFNSFVEEKNMDLPKITSEQYEATRCLINEGVYELYGDVDEV